MTESSTVPGTTDGGQDPADLPAAYTPPASQGDLDRIITERVARVKSQFKDYGELKMKAAELDQMRQTSQTESERQAAELVRWQSEAERWRTDAVGSRIQAVAASDFADPSDAVTALDPAKYLDASGQIDEDAIRADLADVLERKPHWRRADGAPPAPRVPAPNPNQGSGQNGRSAPDPAAEFASILQGQLNRSG